MTIDEGQLQHRFVFPGPSASAEERVRIESGPSAGQPGPRIALAKLGPLAAGARVGFAVENLDDRLALYVEDELVCELDVPSVDLNPGEYASPSNAGRARTAIGFDLHTADVLEQEYERRIGRR